MHPYKIYVKKYSAAGALTDEVVTYQYADSAEQAEVSYRRLLTDYDTQRYEETGAKMFRIGVQVAAYKEIENPKNFFTQFHA